MSGIATLQPSHFRWRMEGAVALISLDRPERKNPLTFESYAELRDLFRGLKDEQEMRKRYEMLLRLGMVEMVHDLKLLEGQEPKTPQGEKEQGKK